MTLYNLGLLNRVENRNAEARKDYEEALAIYREFAARARPTSCASNKSSRGFATWTR